MAHPPIRSAPNSTARPHLWRSQPVIADQLRSSPQRNQAAEIGTKWELSDKHLLGNSRAVPDRRSNARELVPSRLCQTPAPSRPAAAYVQGIDSRRPGKLTDRWSLFGGLVLMNNRVDASAVPGNVGLPLAYIANQSFNILTKYQVNQYIEVGGQATYRSKIYGGTLLAANQGTVLPDYWRFDAFVEGYFIRTTSGNFS